MLEFIAEYWLQFLFGTIVTGMGIGMKKIWNMYKEAKKTSEKENRENFMQEVDSKIKVQNEKMKQADAKILEEIHHVQEEVKSISAGVLSVQGQNFRQNCKRLLESTHIVTVEEFEQVTQDHEVYNSLGGNHTGDILYHQVEEKFKNQQIV